jgi:hypothetical protein|tara:strand:+ start:94 stop:807 length:714 start_codon:yes stop_codon:yes gene_type:complete
MTVTVANTANTNTFDYWRNRTNELADAMTNKTVTVDSNTATGNAVVNGHFVSGTLVANVALRGGNTSTFNTLTISSNVVVSTGNTITVGNSSVNTQITSGNLFLNGSTLVIGNTDSNVTSNSSTLTIGNSSIFTSINSTSVNFSSDTTEIKLGNSTVNVTINSTSLDSSNPFIFAANSAVTVSIGTTAQRPSGAVGQIRYNTDESKYEVYVGGAFDNVITSSEQLKVYDVSNTQVFP